MLRVTIDGNEVIENVVGYSTPGGRLLLLDFQDGSVRGITGYGEFIIERADNPNVK